jgi:hypothetical protein
MRNERKGFPHAPTFGTPVQLENSRMGMLSSDPRRSALKDKFRDSAVKLEKWLTPYRRGSLSKKMIRGYELQIEKVRKKRLPSE